MSKERRERKSQPDPFSDVQGKNEMKEESGIRWQAQYACCVEPFATQSAFFLRGVRLHYGRSCFSTDVLTTALVSFYCA